MGTPGGLGVPQRLPRLMPSVRPWKFCSPGDRINAQTGAAVGAMVNRVSRGLS